MKKKDLLINFISIVFFSTIIFINHDYIENNLVNAIILDTVLGIYFFIICLIKLKGIRNCIYSVEFIYGVVFWMYSIVGSILFVLDNYTPRFNYFLMTEETMTTTLKMYIYISAIYGVICFLFNRIKIYEFNKRVKLFDKKIVLLNSTITFFDIIAVMAMLFSVYNILSFGGGFFSLSVLEKREVLNNGISHYLNLYMVVYSLFLTISYFSKENKNEMFYLRIVMTCIYWLIFLTCERRLFIIFLLGFIMVFFTKVKKIKMKYIISIIVCIIVFLMSAAIRENITLKNHSFSDFLYMSLTEYYCTFSITDAYIVDEYNDYQYGKTYIYDTLTKLCPRFILKDKPEDLSQVFKKEYNLDVGFAYNPVAEGILNFGNYAVITVPIVMLLITIFAKGFEKINALNYVFICTSSLDFCRGAFSNYFFDILFCFVFITIIFNFKVKDDLKDEKNWNNNIP